MVNISQINSNTLQLNNLNKVTLSDLKVGQTLTANIIKPIGSQLLLKIGTQTLLADTKLTNLTSGTLQVTVKQTQPSVILTIAQPNTSVPQSSNNINATLQSTYRQALAHQIPVSQALNQILNLPNLPIAIQSTLLSMIDQLLRPKLTLDGKDLRQYISQSGLFLENKLKDGKQTQTLNQDTKAQLLKLQQQTLSQLQNNPKSEGLKQLNSILSQALNKLTVQQLQMFETPNLMNIEIPMQNSKLLESFRFEIYRHRSPAEKNWEILVQLSIEGQQMDVKLQLNEESETLYCNIWCETAALEQKITENLDLLNHQLDQLSLKNSAIQIVDKPFTASEFATKVALIDISV